MQKALSHTLLEIEDSLHEAEVILTMKLNELQADLRAMKNTLRKHPGSEDRVISNDVPDFNSRTKTWKKLADAALAALVREEGFLRSEGKNLSLV